MINILNVLLEDKDIVEELIKIDNEIMNTKYNFENYYNSFKKLLDSDVDYFNIDNPTLFITEGEVLITLDILRRLNTSNDVVIHISQGFVAMNKWLINKYYELTGNTNVILDIESNYNNYIDKGYRVYPLGEEGLVYQVLGDFYDKE